MKCQCWCILLRNEIGSHPIPTNPAEQCVCSGFDWVAASGLIVMYKVLGENWEKGRQLLRQHAVLKYTACTLAALFQ